MRVAIVGGPGIGKSTLVRQLGDLYHNGAYGKGEEGVWDPQVLDDVATGRNPVGVTAYFADLYDANYRDQIRMGLWIVALGFIALACPNTLQVLNRQEPALGWNADLGVYTILGRPVT